MREKNVTQVFEFLARIEDEINIITEAINKQICATTDYSSSFIKHNLGIVSQQFTIYWDPSYDEDKDYDCSRRFYCERNFA